MKNYHKLLLIGIIFLIGLAFLPIVANAFTEKFGWEEFAFVYQQSKIFLPVVLK